LLPYCRSYGAFRFIYSSNHVNHSPLLVFSEASPTRITIAPMNLSVLFMGSNQFNPPNQKNRSSDNERETFCLLEIASFLAMT
jgi:hypothetical protein